MSEFDSYVVRYSEGRGISVSEALTHQMVKGAKEYYKSHDDFEEKIRRDFEKANETTGTM